MDPVKVEFEWIKPLAADSVRKFITAFLEEAEQQHPDIKYTFRVEGR